MDGWMDGWMDGLMYVCISITIDDKNINAVYIYTNLLKGVMIKNIYV